MPLFKHLRSDYVHLDSVEPDLWTRIAALFRNVRLDDSPSIKTELTASTALPIQIAVPRGDIPGTVAINKFGLNIDLSKDVKEDIWVHEGVAPGQWVGPTDARIHQIASTSGAEDAVAVGAGAWTIRIFGLDSNGLLAEEDIILDGTDDVPTIREYWMIHRMYVLTASTPTGSVGVIYATADVDGTVTAVIPAARNQTFMAIYQIPYDKTGFMSNIWFSALRKLSSGSLDVVMWDKEVGGVWRPQHLDGATQSGTSKVQHEYNPYKVFIAGSIIRLEVVSSANDMNAAGGFDLYLVDN